VGDSLHFLRSAFDDLDKLFAGSRKAFARLPESAEGSACQLEMASWRNNAI